MPYSLVAEGVSFVLPDGTPLLESIDLSLPRGLTGLVGTNGSGKSTLLALLAGRARPSCGRVLRNGIVALLPQTAGPDRAGTARELLGAADAPGWRVDRALSDVGLAGLDLGRPAGTLSGGETTRLRLARLLLEDPETLLLDEPTNHLDEEARRAVHDLVRTFPGAVLVATHDRALLARAARIAELSAGRLRTFGGGWQAFLEARRAEREAVERAVRSAEQELDAARRAAREAADRQAHRSARGRREAARSGLPKIVAGAMKRAAQVSAGRLKGVHEERVGAAREALARARAAAPDEAEICVDLGAAPVPARKRLVDAERLNVLVGGRPLWAEPLSFAVVGPERIRLRGPNGSGKSTLLSLLSGRVPDAGTLRVGAARVALLDQDAAVLGREGTLVEALRRLAPGRPEHERRLLLGRFGFVQEAAAKPVSALSGGERIRAGLAALLATEQAPELLLLDEPSNHLDLPGLKAVASALRAYRGALLLVTHDPAFARDVGVTRDLMLPPGERAGVRDNAGGARGASVPRVSCETCRALGDFAQVRDDSTASLRPKELDRLEVLGSSGHCARVCRCPSCHAVFRWYLERDSDSGVTEESVHRLDGPGAIEALLAGLAWPDVETKAGILEELAARLPGPAPGGLDVTSGEAEALCRAELLGEAAGPLVPALERYVADELGARALAAAGAFEVLERAAARGVRAAIRTLARSGPPGTASTLLAVLTRSTDHMARCEAARGLGRLGAARDGVYAVFLACPESPVREACRDALAAMRATHLLLEALGMPDWSVRWAAAVALGAAGVATPEVLAALERAVLVPGGPPIPRTSAAEALGALGLPREKLSALLAEGLDHADAGVRESARRSLEKLNR